MIAEIENSAAFKALQPYQQSLVIKRDNRLQIENAIIVARTIGYDKWESSTSFSTTWRSIVKEIVKPLN